jgi:hypothetical protein
VFREDYPDGRESETVTAQMRDMPSEDPAAQANFTDEQELAGK